MLKNALILHLVYLAPRAALEVTPVIVISKEHVHYFECMACLVLYWPVSYLTLTLINADSPMKQFKNLANS